MNQNEQTKQPFFAQFLEAQAKEEKENYNTTKPLLDLDQTMKAPSDRDET